MLLVCTLLLLSMRYEPLNCLQLLRTGVHAPVVCKLDETLTWSCISLVLMLSYKRRCQR